MLLLSERESVSPYGSKVLKQVLISSCDSIDIKEILHPLTGIETKACPLLRAQIDTLSPCLRQSLRMPWWNDKSGITHDLSAIPDVSDYAGNRGSHGFSNHHGKGLAKRGRQRRYIERGGEPRNILTQSKQSAPASYGRLIDPSSQRLSFSQVTFLPQRRKWTSGRSRCNSAAAWRNVL